MSTFLSEFDPDYLYDPRELKLTEGSKSVMHRAYRVVLHHEFPRDWKSPGEPVKAEFLEGLEKPKNRTKFLWERLLSRNSNENRILFFSERAQKDDKLNDVLDRMFSEAKWHCASIDRVNDVGFDWKSNPVAWDVKLSELNLTLDKERHRPFVDRSAEHYDDELS